MQVRAFERYIPLTIYILLLKNASSNIKQEEIIFSLKISAGGF